MLVNLGKKGPLAPQGVYLKKKLTGGLGLFLGSEIFDILIFWVWKNLSYFFGSEDFSLIFLGVTILIQFIFYFLFYTQARCIIQISADICQKF